MVYKFTSTVIKGKSLGSELGFPTANVKLEKGKVEDGTYKINIVVDNVLYHGAGVYLEKLGLFEAFIFDFDMDIYDKEIEIIVLEKIRENKKFNSLEELKNQIHKDIENIKAKQNHVLTFGTFDHVHDGHRYYLENAKKYGDKLVTVVATDKNVEKFKGKAPLYKQDKRVEDVKSLGISDMVCIGEETNALNWVDLYMPSVVCLGYDQASYTNELQKYIEENDMDTIIVRLEPFKPEIYKSSKLKK